MFYVGGLNIVFSLKGAISLNWAHLFAYSLKSLSGRLSLTAHCFFCLEYPGCEKWWWGWVWRGRGWGRGEGEGRSHQRQRDRRFEEWPWGQQAPHSQWSAWLLAWSPHSSWHTVHCKGCWELEVLPPPLLWPQDPQGPQILPFPLSNQHLPPHQDVFNKMLICVKMLNISIPMDFTGVRTQISKISPENPSTSNCSIHEFRRLEPILL